MEDTIAAISTPPGSGGIGVIRISGANAGHIAQVLFRPSKKSKHFVSHHLYHGDIIAPETGKVLDEVLITLMEKPRSFTGEDTLEIYCHGGRLITEAILGETIKAGCRLAMPGEFTKRAFLNNRLDLSQAEAVFDIITAKTERGRELALSHLKGTLSAKIEDLRSCIIHVLALIEASIDFSEDEISGRQNKDVFPQLTDITDKLRDLLLTYDHGKILRNGIGVVIAGKPNAGKSSLLNALLGEKRAIVTPIPGTTRDFIEEFVNIEGIAVKLTDTAGIRTPENAIEKEGIDFLREKLAVADLIIILLDGSVEFSADDRNIISDTIGRDILVALNKIDLPSRLPLSDVEALMPGTDIIPISAKYGDGLSALKKAIYKAALGTDIDCRSDAIISNMRHKCSLEKAASFISQAKDGILNNLSPELIAVDLNDALASLGEIAGKTASDDILEQIFSHFCIGK